MSSDAPAIPLFGDAYLADTRHLSLEEHGAYLQLMMIAWRSPNCALPDDDARLARMLGITAGRWVKLKPAVMGFWEMGENGWTQKRLSKERAYVETRRQSQREKAAAKWESPELDGDMSPARKRAARLSAARQKSKHTKEDWETLVALTGNRCVKCHASGVDLVKDHILPIYLGGSDGLENLQPLCIPCNSSKSSDSTDFRLSACKDLFERLPNACRTPAPPPPPLYISEPKGSSMDATRAQKPRATRIPANWKPGPLPSSVKSLAARWPPGRLDRELDGFRDYWAARTRDAARLDWDKVWHNRIRDQHDRIMRENQNGSGYRASGNGTGPRPTRAQEMDIAYRELGFGEQPR